MPAELDRNAGMEEALDRFWDQVSQGRSGAAGDLDPADAATIRHLHAFDYRPEPTPAFTRRLRGDLMHAHAIQVSSGPSVSPLPNSRASHPWHIGPQARPPSSRHWALAQLATAALLLLTLVGSFFAFGPGRPGQGFQEPAIIPALSGTPESMAGPIAEFLWQSTGDPDLPFGTLGEPAVDPEGNLWVPDASYGQFLIFAPDGTFLEAWGTPGSGEGEFAFESTVMEGVGFGDVAFDTLGNIYVADSGNYRIQKFGPDRGFITSWGSEGFADGQFRLPAAVAVDERGRVYVSDEGWGKIEVFDSDGNWLETWTGVSTPVGLAVDGDGNIWVADLSGSIVQFSADGDSLAVWKSTRSGDGAILNPKSVAVDAQGRVFVADLGVHRIQVFAPDGTFLGAWGERGTAAGQFVEPRGIALDGEGAVYVTEFDGERVQMFRLLPPFGP